MSNPNDNSNPSNNNNTNPVVTNPPMIPMTSVDKAVLIILAIFGFIGLGYIFYDLFTANKYQQQRAQSLSPSKGDLEEGILENNFKGKNVHSPTLKSNSNNNNNSPSSSAEV